MATPLVQGLKPSVLRETASRQMHRPGRAGLSVHSILSSSSHRVPRNGKQPSSWRLPRSLSLPGHWRPQASH